MVIIKRSQINLRLSSYVSRDEIDLNQLSFGISGGLIQSQLDRRFTGSNYRLDSCAKRTYFNVDFGASLIIWILCTWYC
jgi:hypothetical protein